MSWIVLTLNFTKFYNITIEYKISHSQNEDSRNNSYEDLVDVGCFISVNKDTPTTYKVSRHFQSSCQMQNL